MKNMQTPRSGWLSANQARRRLKVSRATLLRLINEGVLPAYKIGWMIRLLVDDVEAYRRQHPREDGD
jgi:excisionase family DNA binding protein